MSLKIPRRVYAEMFGPTTGDRVRLADTDLIIRIERDLTIYGDECKFGGEKSSATGWGSRRERRRTRGARSDHHECVDPRLLGIVKADIGIKGAGSSGLEKGKSEIMDGVTAGMVVGAATEVIAGEDDRHRRGSTPHSLHLPAADR